MTTDINLSIRLLNMNIFYAEHGIKIRQKNRLADDYSFWQSGLKLKVRLMRDCFEDRQEADLKIDERLISRWTRG